jgi:hypothetical protein
VVVEEEDVNDDAEALTDEARALIRSERALGLRGDDKSTDAFRKAQHRFVITAYARWRRTSRPETSRASRSSSSRIRAKHIDIDTKTLFGIVQPVRPRKGVIRTRRTSRSCTYAMTWNSVFRLTVLRNSRDARVERPGLQKSVPFQLRLHAHH